MNQTLEGSDLARLWVALDAACGLSHMHNSTPKAPLRIVDLKVEGLGLEPREATRTTTALDILEFQE